MNFATTEQAILNKYKRKMLQARKILVSDKLTGCVCFEGSLHRRVQFTAIIIQLTIIIITITPSF